MSYCLKAKAQGRYQVILVSPEILNNDSCFEDLCDMVCIKNTDNLVLPLGVHGSLLHSIGIDAFLYLSCLQSSYNVCHIRICSTQDCRISTWRGIFIEEGGDCATNQTNAYRHNILRQSPLGKHINLKFR